MDPFPFFPFTDLEDGDCWERGRLHEPESGSPFSAPFRDESIERSKGEFRDAASKGRF